MWPSFPSPPWLAVLALRGRQLVAQPLQDDANNVLLWNGEVFGGIKVTPCITQARRSECTTQSSDLTLAWVVLWSQVSEEQNDTAVLLALLSGCNTTTEIVELLETVEGPYAFVYWQVRLSRGLLIVVMACLLKLTLLLGKQQATVLRQGQTGPP
jgi:asparagine synthetase B (glutamine-hydrolysing)